MTCDSIFFLEINLIVALRGDAKETQLDKEGSYYMNIQYINKVNGKPYWMQENGNNAIWYNNGVWLIGKQTDLGTEIAEIQSSDDVANPYQATKWTYVSKNNGKWIESNDILVWPKKSMVPRAIWPSFVLLR